MNGKWFANSLVIFLFEWGKTISCQVYYGQPELQYVYQHYLSLHYAYCVGCLSGLMKTRAFHEYM